MAKHKCIYPKETGKKFCHKKNGVSEIEECEYCLEQAHMWKNAWEPDDGLN